MIEDPNFDQVADVLILVALRILVQNKEDNKGDDDVDSGILPSLD